MSILSGHQPNFLPWIKYFEKIALSDIFTYSNDVKYSQKTFVSRTTIRLKNSAILLTIPVYHVNDFQRIFEKKIVKNDKILTKIVNSIYYNLKREQYFKDVKPVLDIIKSSYEKFDRLDKFNMNINNFIIEELLGIKTKKYIGFDLGLQDFTKNQRIAKNCQIFQSDIYLSGTGGQKYMDLRFFTEEKIQVFYFRSHIYNQLKPEIQDSSIIKIISSVGQEYLIEKFDYLIQNREQFLIPA